MTFNPCRYPSAALAIVSCSPRARVPGAANPGHVTACPIVTPESAGIKAPGKAEASKEGALS